VVTCFPPPARGLKHLEQRWLGNCRIGSGGPRSDYRPRPPGIAVRDQEPSAIRKTTHHLRPFRDEPIETSDYEAAAKAANDCRSKGMSFFPRGYPDLRCGTPPSMVNFRHGSGFQKLLQSSSRHPPLAPLVTLSRSHAVGNFDAHVFGREGQGALGKVDEVEQEFLARCVGFVQDVEVMIELLKPCARRNEYLATTAVLRSRSPAPPSSPVGLPASQLPDAGQSSPGKTLATVPG